MSNKTTWVVGNHAVTAVLMQNPERVLSMHVVSYDRHPELLEKANAMGISITPVDKQTLAKKTGIPNHQGIAIQVRPRKEGNEKELQSHIENLLNNGETPFILMLDQVSDPHNLGACLRTADAAGVDAVVLTKNNTSPITPVVQKVASGAAETVNIFRVSNLARAIETVQQQGVWVIGTSDKAQESLYQQKLSGSLAIVMGAEGSGLRQLTEKKCDQLVKLPMAGQVVSSLNVSVATGVCLFEVVRQKSNKG